MANDTFRSTFLASLADSKKRALTDTSELKQQLLQRTSALPTALPTRDNTVEVLPGDDLRRYANEQEYRAAGNRLTLDAAQYFREKARLDDQASAALQAADQAQREDTAWASDADVSSPLGFGKQIAAALATGSARVAGEGSAAALTAAAEGMTQGASDQERDLARREQQLGAITNAETDLMLQKLQGRLAPMEATVAEANLAQARSGIKPLSPEEKAYLDEEISVPTRASSGNSGNIAADTASGLAEDLRMTRRERLQGAGKGFEIAGDVNQMFTDSTAGIINTGRRDALDADLSASYAENKGSFTKAKQAWDAGSTGSAVGEAAVGIAGLVADGSVDIVSNPIAAFEYMTENAPQLALAAGGHGLLAASNLAYGARIYNDSIEDYKRQNGGALPSRAEAAQRLAISLSASALEEVMDVQTLKSMGVMGKLAKTAEQSVEDLAHAATAQGRKALINRLGGSVSEIATDATRVGLGEALTEAGQTAIEENFSKLNTDVDGEQIFKAGAVGAAAGGGITAVGKTADELKQGGYNNKMASTTKERERQTAEYQAAVETGDVSTYVNGTQKTKPDLLKAVDALLEHTTREGATDAQKKTGMATVRDIVTKLTAEADAARTAYETSAPEQVTKIKELLAKNQAELAALDPANTEQKQILEDKIKLRVDALAELDTGEAGREALKVALDTAEVQREMAQSRLDQLAQQIPDATPVAPVEVIPAADLAADLDIVDSTPDVADAVAVEKHKVATERVLSMAMNMPESLDSAQVDRLVSSTSSVITEPQRDYLKELQAAKQAEIRAKGLEGVNSDVFNGGNGFIGLKQYQEQFSTGMQQDRGAAYAALAGLQKFAKAQSSRSEALSRVFGSAAVQRDGKTVYVAPDKNGNWVPVSGSMTEDERIAARAIYVNARSAKLINAAAAQAGALQQSTLAMRKAYALKFQAAPAVSASAPLDAPSSAAPAAPAQQPSVSSASAETSKPGAVESVGPQGEATPPNAEASVSTDARTEDAPSSAEQSEAAEEAQPTTGKLSLFERVKVWTKEEWDTALAAHKANPYHSKTNREGKFHPYQLVNIVAQYMVQKGGSKRDASVRPLVQVRDFMQQMATSVNAAYDYLTDKDITEEQFETRHSTLKHFTETHAKWLPSLDKLLNKKASERMAYRYKDPVQFLLNELTDGQVDLDENVKTAIVVALYTYVSENAKTPKLTNEQINKLLGRDKDHGVTADERQWLSNIGIRDKALDNQVGQRVIEALGLTLKPGAPAGEVARLQAALGRYAVKLGREVGVLDRVYIPDKVMTALYSKGTQTVPEIVDDLPNGADPALFLKRSEMGKGTKHYFVRIKKTDPEQKTMAPEVEAIYTNSAGSGGVLNKLFGVENSQTFPVFEPASFKDKTVKRMKQLVPSKLAKILDKQSKEAHVLRQDMWQVYSLMDDRLKDVVLGIMPLEEKRLHASNRLAQEAKNDGLKHQKEQMDTWVSMLGSTANKLNTEFFFEFFVAKTQRVHPKTSAINRQTSHLHRHMITMAGTEATVKFDSDVAIANFKLVVAGALGYKFDKQGTQTTVDQFDAFLANTQDQETQYLHTAVTGLRDVLNGRATELSGEAQVAIEMTVKGKDHGIYVVDALVALASYYEAKATNQKSFKTSLLAEIDGVTNGPMLTQLLYGTADLEVLKKGGFFTAADTVVSYPEWRGQAGAQDLYETQAATMQVKLANLIRENPAIQDIMPAITALTGNLVKAGRKMVKTPLTAMVFGSGIKTSISNMGDEFVEGYYTQLEAIANSGIVDEQELSDRVAALHKQMNHLIAWTYPSPKAAAKHLFRRMTLDEAMAQSLSFAQIRALKATHEATLGEAMKQALEENFKDLLAVRRRFNQAANLAHQIYQVAYQQARAAKIAELVASGEMATVIRDGKPEPAHDLTSEQEMAVVDSVRHLDPVLASAMSQASNQKDAGLFLAKTQRDMESTPAFEVEATFANGTKLDYEQTAALRQRLIDPGVMALIASVHSTDSAIASAAYGDLKALNIHDALGITLDQVVEAATLLNQHTFHTVLEYSPGQALMDTMQRNLTRLHQMLSQDEYGAALKQELANTVNLFRNTVLSTKAAKQEFLASERGILEFFMIELARQSHAGDKNKLTYMSQFTTVSQYGWANQSYTVTDADRALAQAKLDDLNKRTSPIDKEFVKILRELDGFVSTGNQLNAALSAQAAETAEAVDPEVQGEPEAEAAPVTVMDMEILEQIRDMESLSAKLRTAATKALEHIQQTGQSVVEAAEAALSKTGAGELLTLVNRFKTETKHPLGQLGQSSIESDAQWVAFFEAAAGEPIAIRDVMREAYRRLKQDLATSPNNVTLQAQLPLLARAAEIMDPSVVVQYVTPLTKKTQYHGTKLTRARGWFSIKGTDQKIFVKSTDFATSGLTTEMLVHEVVHAALMATIDDAQKNPKHSAHGLIQDLEQLREAAEARIKADPKLADLLPAVENVHELVSWGMTNAAFQRQVLGQITMAASSAPHVTARKAAAPTNGWQGFLQTLARIFFGTEKGEAQLTKATTGLTLLITHVSLLTEEAANTQAKARELSSNMAVPDPRMTTTQMFEALDNRSVVPLTPGFKGQLESIVKAIADKVRDPFTAYQTEKDADPSMDPIDRYLQTLAAGMRPFSSQLRGLNLKMGDQTLFVAEQVEAVLRQVSRDTVASPLTRRLTKDMQRIWKEASTTITKEQVFEAFTGKTWAQATALEKLTAQDQWNFLFKSTQNADRTFDQVERFTALVLTVPEVARLAEFRSYRNTKSLRDMKWGERAITIINRVLNWIGLMQLPGHSGEFAHTQLRQLVDNLVDIEHKAQRRLAKQDSTIQAKMEDWFSNSTTKIRGGIVKAAEAPFVKRNRLQVVRIAGEVTATIAGDRVAQFYDEVQKYRDMAQNEKSGIIFGTLNELRGPLEWVHAAILGAKRHEQIRKGIKEGTAKTALGGYARELDKATRALVTAVGLRPNLSALLDGFSMAEIGAMVRDEATLTQRIGELESALPASHRALYSTQAKDLGAFLTTGVVTGKLLQKNAYAIARAWGHPAQRSITEADAARAQETIGQLVSLYALTHTSVADRQAFADLMDSELGRDDGGNGVHMTLLLHKRFQEGSVAKLFEGSEGLTIHGYLPEMYKPGIELTAVTELDRVEMENRGWDKVGPLFHDRDDPERKGQTLMVIEDRGMRPFVSGATSLTGRRGRGTSKYGSLINPLDGTPHIKNQRTNAEIVVKKLPAIAKLEQRGMGYKPDIMGQDNNMAPVFNARGQIVNWTYQMRNDMKDNLLQREQDFSLLLGTYQASIFDKVSTAEQNRKVVEALHAQHAEEFATRAASYLEISATSADPELKELWHLIPEEMRRDAKDVSGHPRMYVRADQVDQIFGFHKYTPSRRFDKLTKAEAARRETLTGTAVTPELVRGVAEEIVLGMLEKILGKKAGKRLGMAQDMWQEMVAMTKDILVVKTGGTLVGNLLSNVSQLLWTGVSPVAIIRHGTNALVGAVQYRAAAKELQHLTTLRDAQVPGANTPELEQRIAELENDMQRNPVRELIEAGLLPTIVEDVSVEDEEHETYVTWFQKRLQGYTDRVPVQIKTVAKYAFITHDTPLYRVLSQGTQLSDFVARYTLYQHMTTRRRNPLSKEAAILRASDDFVNYDIPSHPALQYLNDMGLLFFTKYYLRIQRTILGLWRDNPVRGLMLLLGDMYFTTAQTLLDSTMSLGNPLDWGAFKLMGAWNDNLVLQGIGDMFSALNPIPSE